MNKPGFSSGLARCLAGTGLAVLMCLIALEPVMAQSTTNQMSCSAAKRQYSSSGRVYIRTPSGQVLPIYSGVPADQAYRLDCGYDSFTNPVMVPTRDRRQCVVAYNCG